MPGVGMARNGPRSDALVLFGAAGDLAFKKLFPALQAMVKRGTLHAPIIAVARTDWDDMQLRRRARASIEQHAGGVDEACFDRLSGLLRAVTGDYESPETFRRIGTALGSAEHPAFYLAIPPILFSAVVAHLRTMKCAAYARVIVEKPFGRDLASARALNQLLLGTFSERQIFRIDHYLGKRPVHNLVLFRCANAFIESFWNRDHVESVQITLAEDFGVRGRGAFFEQTGTIRDVMQNHLLQLLANVAMEPPVRSDSESRRDETGKVLKSIRTADPDDLIRGQVRGYREERGVDPNSTVETYAELRLHVDSWRWQGVPFFLRAGKSLPVNCTEVVARLRRTPAVFPNCMPQSNHFRFRISPDTVVAIGLTVMDSEERGVGQQRELLASRHPGPDDMDAYERVLGDAMDGDQTLFARQDHVEEAWRIVDPLLGSQIPPYVYEPGSWGPDLNNERTCPPGGWQNP